ncbi:DsbE family thiol:disulfide interchange protein [Lichenibacterium ramalinae]|uniref:DsbE family thiol:disulfide interchange protein n=1 Tax=Lichenibacterium ramalinae TaxID=2316527 RepID=A0A4Q2REH0_9HYPH|nr:DsbE family thiol:disulfide interchange protein [Lichenibacterium ramalinae]RYB03836.1 DsbE family thiol:disulfide interchange protein [Lichenibacterium ramalinae]
MSASGTSDGRPGAAPEPEGSAVPRARRLLAALPLLAFAGLAALFLARLGAGDPSRIPSPLIGLPVPDFALPSLPGRAAPPGAAAPAGLDAAALKRGHVTLLNVFASWCAECHDEHGLLMMLAASPRMKELGIPLDGIVYKDRAEDARRYLGTKGDPYGAVGDDRSGRTAIDFGVYGVPETFVVRGDGTLAYKLIGPVTPDNLGTLEAEIEKAAR